MRHFLITLLLLASCQALNVSAEAKPSEKLTILRSQDDWGPNEFVNGDGQLTGYHIDLIRLAAEELQIEVEFISMPWKRVINSMKEGLADAVSYVIHTPAREDFLIYHPGNIISQGSSRFAYLKGRGLHYDGTPQSVQDHRIGVINGYNYGSQFERERFNNLVNTNGEKQQLMMLLNKRVDFILVNIDHIRFKFGEIEGFEQIETADISSVSHDIYLAFSKIRGNEELSRRFAEVIPRIRASERYQKLRQQYAHTVK